jgi:hypothetical protein
MGRRHVFRGDQAVSGPGARGGLAGLAGVPGGLDLDLAGSHGSEVNSYRLPTMHSRPQATKTHYSLLLRVHHGLLAPRNFLESFCWVLSVNLVRMHAGGPLQNS